MKIKTIKAVIKRLNKKDFTINREVYSTCIYFRVDKIEIPVELSLYINFHTTYVNFFDGLDGDSINIKYEGEPLTLDLLNMLLPEKEEKVVIDNAWISFYINKLIKNIIMRIL